MRLFVSWSGKRSGRLAKYLGQWISEVIQAVDPWLSQDIQKGAGWDTELIEGLDNTKFGVFCLTRDNLNAPWMLFEAGAVSKMQGRAATLLLDLKPSDVPPPLSRFQATSPTRDDILKLVNDINDAVRDADQQALDPERLSRVFAKNWPELESEIERVNKDPVAALPARTDRELLEEILTKVRSLHGQQPQTSVGDWLSSYRRSRVAEGIRELRGLMGHPSVGGDPELLGPLKRVRDMLQAFQTEFPKKPFLSVKEVKEAAQIDELIRLIDVRAHKYLAEDVGPPSDTTSDTNDDGAQV